MPPDEPPQSPFASAEPGYEPVKVDGAEPADVLDAEVLDSGAPAAPPFPGAPPLPPKPAAQVPDNDELAPQDRDFIQRIFVQVKDVDFRAPPPPPPRRDLAGPDKKIAMLRQKVHELERDLARVGSIWATLQSKYESVEKIIKTKESERQSVLDRQKDLRAEMAKASAQGKADLDAARQRIAQLDTMRNALDADLKNTRAQAERAVQELNGRITK